MRYVYVAFTFFVAASVARRGLLCYHVLLGQTKMALTLFLCHTGFVFQFSTGITGAVKEGCRREIGWSALLRPKAKRLVFYRSMVQMVASTAFVLSGQFMPVGIGYAIALAVRTLSLVLLAPLFNEKIERIWNVIGMLFTTFVGCTCLYLGATGYDIGICLEVFGCGSPAAPIPVMLPMSDLIYGGVLITVNEIFFALGLYLNRAAAKSGEDKFTTIAYAAVPGVLVFSILWMTPITLTFPYGWALDIPEIFVPDFSAAGIASVFLFAGILLSSVVAQYYAQLAAAAVPTSSISSRAQTQVLLGLAADAVFWHLWPNLMTAIGMSVLVLAMFIGLPSVLEAERKRAAAKLARTGALATTN